MNGQKALGNVKTVIWDLDGVFFPYDDAHLDDVRNSTAFAALKAGVSLDFDKARTMGADSHLKHGSAHVAFVKEFGVDEDYLHLERHRRQSTDFIKKCDETASAFARSGRRHAILTQASKEWAIRVITAKGVFNAFPGDHIFGFEDVGYKQKDKSFDPFRAILGKLGCHPHETVMVEDSHKNLVHPHQEGMHTIYIHHGRPLAEIPAYVHHQCFDQLAALKFLNQHAPRVQAAPASPLAVCPS